MRIQITRRQLAIALLAVAGGAGATVWLATRDDGTPLTLDLPPSDNPFNPNYEVFLALSKILLMRPRLDGDVARRMYEIFRDEPWGPKHIGHAYATLRGALATAQANRRTPPDLTTLGSGERWFVGHLVTTWYLGIYYHEQRPTRRITLAGALMYDAAKGVVPIPYHDSTGFGGWTEPPKS